MHARTPGPHEKHARCPRVPDLSELFRHVSYAVFRSTSRPTKVHKSSKRQSGLQGPMGLASDLLRAPRFPKTTLIDGNYLPAISLAAAKTCCISLSHVKITSHASG
ncbi:hypothetical protein CLIM01_13562 [Colletotrichum limetticola]|uniref:Uncharacterized protein n=1 Tax=Colletotrichum limetticola TaxID=1209924 RepID=A0ABQ9PB02_9PEZI|nr:hypothetical protein CLIM01_13562 [Colletotrichum limetticola]